MAFSGCVLDVLSLVFFTVVFLFDMPRLCMSEEDVWYMKCCFLRVAHDIISIPLSSPQTQISSNGNVLEIDVYVLNHNSL